MLSPSLPRVMARGRFFHSHEAGVHIFRGVALSARLNNQTFEDMVFDARNAAFLAQHGINIIRCGVVWANLEPRPGVYNQAYIDSVVRTVQTLKDHGIYTIVDYHMD